MQFIYFFPRIRIEVRFDSEGIVEDPGHFQRELVMQLLSEQGLRVRGAAEKKCVVRRSCKQEGSSLVPNK